MSKRPETRHPLLPAVPYTGSEGVVWEPEFSTLDLLLTPGATPNPPSNGKRFGVLVRDPKPPPATA